MDFCDIECFVSETNRDHSVVFEIASKYCISDSFVDYKGYSISSKGFLPRAVMMAQEHGPEDLPHVQGKEQRLRFAGAALKKNPASKV